jgi:sugar phosphate isomerase/epimerase
VEATRGARRNPILYNTNGFAFHRLEDAVRLLAALGYDGVALTPDVHHLDPLRSSPSDVAAFRGLLEETGLSVVVETGARFVLDPARKHRPTLIDEPAQAALRLDFLRRCTDLAVAVGAPVVSTWSGAAPEGLDPEEALDRLAHGLRRLCEHAAGSGVRIGFEPEPGMVVETVEGWSRVRESVGHPALGLTLDVGHCLATREGDPARILRRHAAEVVVLQVDDHRPGRHDHLMFGEGEVRWPDVAAAVRETGWTGPVEVELSRHSAEAPSAAERSLAFLRPLFPAA